MIITKQEVSPGMYQVTDVTVHDVTQEENDLKPGMIEGKDGTRVLMLDAKGHPQIGHEDSEKAQERSHQLATVVAMIGGLSAAVAQCLMLMAARSDELIISQEAKARIEQIQKSPPENEDEPDDKIYLRVGFKSE